MLARAVAVVASAAVVAGCSTGGDPALDAPCTGGAASYAAALEDAPGEVRVEDVAISECVSRARETGDLQLVGEALVDVAAGLGRRADAGDSRAALELGYLIGAARRGAARTGGLHAELVRRLEQELDAVEVDEAALRRGASAGRRGG